MSVLISDSFKIRESTSSEWENIQFSINSPGVPVGGMAGQVLAKNSTTNYDTEWIDPPEPTNLDRLEAQVTYTAMMTDTLLEE